MEKSFCLPFGDGTLPFTPDARVLLFPIRREELRRPRPAAPSTDGFDEADFAPRWWPAETEAE